LDPTQTINAASVLEKLIEDEQSEIIDGEIIKRINNREFMEEERVDVGYNFPPILKIQGPFLSQCKQKKLVFDIGAGHGNDTIMARLSGATVIPVDIFPEQLAFLNSRAAPIFDKKPKDKVFITLNKDFSKVGSVDEKHVGKVNIINANKIMHFLDEQETINFIDNAYLMLSNNGLMFITVSTPEEAHQREGVSYTKRTINFNKELGTKSVGEEEEITKEESLLGSLRNKREYINIPKSQSYEYYGRHFHTIDTLRDYLSPKFDIVDYTNVRGVSEELFISIIAKKCSI
jgi:SAM-dependent methyltransferase